MRIASSPKLVVALMLIVTLVPGGASAQGGCAGPAAGGEWPVFGQNVETARSQPDETTIGPDNVGGLEPVWVFPSAGVIESSPVVAGGCLYIGTQGGDVYALNADDGGLVWQVKLPSATTLSVANGRVFVQSGGTVSALDASSGEIAWQRTMEGFGGIGSPLAFETYVFAGFTGCGETGRNETPCRGRYVILDQATGTTMVDRYDVSDEELAGGMEGPGSWSHPSYDPEDRYIYLGAANTRSTNPENPRANALLKIDADPVRATYGDIVGHFRGNRLNDLPNSEAGAMVCGDSGPPVGPRSFACIDDQDWPSTAVIYRDSDGRKLIGSPHHTAADELPWRTWASVFLPRGTFFALDPDTMQDVWRAPTTGVRASVAAYDGTNIYYASGLDGIVAVDKDTGSQLWQATSYGPNQWQHVSAANGVVYAPSGSAGLLAPTGPGLLLAYDARDGTPLVQRPMGPDIGDLGRGTIAGGVTIARNTVYAPVNGVQAGYVVAYRLG